MTCRRIDDAGAWVLRALDDASYDEHLRGCPECRAEVARLQPVADALPLATEQLAPPPALRDRIMSVVESEAQLLRAAGPEADRVAGPPKRRRGWSWAMPGLRHFPVAGLATVLLAIGVAGGVLLSDDGGRPATRTVQAQVGMSGASALIRITDGHARLEVAGMRNPPGGRVYQVWLKTGSHFPQPTDALFTVSRDGSGHVDVPVSVVGVDQILVTSEPRGGSEKPTTEPVISAAV